MRVFAMLSAACLAMASSPQDAPPGIRLELYDVRDLIAPGSALDGKVLAELIRSNVGARDAAFQDGMLAVRAKAEDQAAIRKTLDRVRKGDEGIIAASARIIISLQDLRPAKSDVLATRLKRDDAISLTNRLMDESALDLATIPRMSLFVRQAGTVFAGSQITYVSGWRFAIGADGKGKPEPVRTSATVGTTVTFVPVVEDRRIRLDALKIDIAEPRQAPPETRKIETPHGTIEDPEIRTVQYELSSPIGDGETLLVGPLMNPWGGKDASKVWLLISGEVLRAPR